MDVPTLEARTGIPVRRLRYVIDHKVVPGLKFHQDQHAQGKPRRFADDAGIAIACAAVLLETGLSRERTTFFLASLLRIPWKKEDVALQVVLSGRFPARGYLGDGCNVRLVSEGYDSGWLQPKLFAKLDKSYQPRVILELDIGAIRDKVIG